MSYSGTRSQGFFHYVRKLLGSGLKSENTLLIQIADLETQLAQTKRYAARCDENAKKYLSELRIANQSHDRLSDQNHTLHVRLDRIAKHGRNSKNGTALLMAKMARGEA